MTTVTLLHKGRRGLFLFVVGLALAACGGNKPKPDEVFLMPAPEVYDESGDTLFAGTDLIARGEHPGVLYATDRTPAAADDKKQRYYTDERANELRLGVARIRLGEGEDITWEEARRSRCSRIAPRTSRCR